MELWTPRTRPSVSLARAVILVCAVGLASRGGGWFAVAVFGAWAFLDGATVLGSAFRRYDEGTPWGLAFAEGMIQLVVGVFICLWWGTLGGVTSQLVGMAVLLSALCVLVAALAEIWNGSDARIAPGAPAAVFLAIAALTSGRPTADALFAAIAVYAVVFSLVAAARSIRLAGGVSVEVARRISLAAAAITGSVVLVIALR